MEKYLPKNWIVCELTKIAQVQSGGTPSRGNAAYWNGTIPWVKISDLKEFYVSETAEFITEEGLKNSSTRIFPKGTILFTIFATIGKVGVLDIEATTNQAIAGITPSTKINSKFLTYNLIQLSNQILGLGKGVAQKNINQSILKNTLIGLPPLPEQNRIVAKLDTLFEQLEGINTSLDRIQVLLKNFRQQVLTQAVTGKLTEEWRKGKNLDDWEKLFLNDLVLESSNGFSKRRNVEGVPITVLRLADFRDATRIFGNERSIPMSTKELNKYQLEKNDVLVIRVNGSVDLAGRFIPYSPSGEVEAYCDHFIRYKYDLNKVKPKFITYVANSGNGREFLKSSLSTSAGQNTINQKSIGSLEINLPTIEEQREIVTRVESLFQKADAIEQQYRSLKEKIEKLPQSILHKAFNGNLVPQLESDGDARDLVREIENLKCKV